MPTNAELLERRNAAVVRGIGHVTTLFAQRAENGEIWDVEGRRYVSFVNALTTFNKRQVLCNGWILI